MFKAGYRCEKGHMLRFPLYKTHCSKCNEYHYTSRCKPCDVRLCTACRPPPCSQQQCPLSHDFTYSPDGASVICDLCGVSLSILATRAVYGDRNCNFDICKACHSKQPQDHPHPGYKDEKVVTEDTEDAQPYRFGWGGMRPWPQVINYPPQYSDS